jgi:parvulin-like peptidyl-prolyl isomerase
MIEEKLVVLAAKEGPPGFKEAADAGRAPSNPYLPAGTEIEEEMERLFDQTRQSFGRQDDFEAALRAERVSIPEFRNRLRERVRDQMTFSRMAKIKEQEFRGSLRVSDEEMLAFYDANKARFAQGDQVQLRHILFPAGAEAQARSVLAELRKAADVKSAFIAAARRHSADEPTREQGGNLGWIEKGQSWPELEAPAFSAKAGSLVGPVRSEAGVHLLLVEGHQSGKARTFEEVKPNVRNLIYQQKNQRRLAEWVDELKRKYYIERKEPAL